MASKIRAINENRPRIDLGKAANNLQAIRDQARRRR